MTIADHIQRVLKPNFGAVWDEVGNEFEKEETFTLSTVKTLEGEKASNYYRTFGNFPSSKNFSTAFY